jgi:hypothetical protein
MRTIGFFADPTVGVVQCPHAFYNHDPLQKNLAMRKVIPYKQRFFFDAIMPSRDGVMTLQSTRVHDEQRFEFDEPISIFSAAGMLSTGRVRDMSLSGVAIVVDSRTRIGGSKWRAGAPVHQ